MKYESGMPGIDVGFRNIINEHHSIDTSVKVKRTLIISDIKAVFKVFFYL